MNKVAKQSEDLYKEKIEQLKKIYPALFSDEGNLNEEELRAFLKQFASTSEGKYEFNWAGKMSAKRNAFTTSRAMLKPDKDRSIDFDNTENLIIEGDNLEVLKLLQKSYQGRIKCIYIDPPYNTGNDFIYTDNFSEDKKAYWEKSGTTQDGVKLDTNTESQGRYHSNWLNMIYPRLLVARTILSETGTIFVSIDDNELVNLRKVLDEIFGEENFISIFPRITKKAGKSGLSFAKNNDFIVAYSKSEFGRFNSLTFSDSEFKYEDEYVEERGKYKLNQALDYDSIQYSPSLDYEIEIEGQLLRPGGVTKTEMIERQQRNPKTDFCWRWSKELYEYGKEKGFVVLKKTINGFRIYTKTYKNATIKKINGSYQVVIEERTKPISTLDFIDNKYSNDNSNKQLKELFKTDIFSYSKPASLIKMLTHLATDKEDTILDFFAGSGTTAQAVMELNKEDSGNRKFILVQIPEKTDESSEAYKAGYKKISDICIERVKRVSNKLKEEKAKGDLGFKVFTLSPSYFPENLFTPDPEKTEEENKKALAKYIEEASTQLEFKFDEFDLMYEVLLKDGFTLNFKAEKLPEFTKNNIYKVTDGEKHAYVTLDGDLKDETLQKLQSYTEERFICLERAVDTTKKWNLQNMFGSNLWVI